MSKSNEKRNLLAGTLTALILLSGASPANAQVPWGYSPLTGSNSYLWLSRSLFGNGLFRGGYGSGGYLVNSLAYNGVYGVAQGINAIGKKKAAKQYYNNPANGINAPVVDQISQAPWYYPPRVPPAQVQAALPAVLADNKDPFADPKAGEFMPVPASINDDAPSTQPVSGGMPAVAALNPSKSLPAAAPDFRAGSPSRSAQPIAADANSANPFAQSFIDHVNDKYSGDISKAFDDKQTKAYAKALGILETNKISDLPTDRIELIKHILQDPNEDSLTKVNTIRLLIRH